MIILGITGSIGMGKSAAVKWLRRRHIPVFDADKVVHALSKPHSPAIKKISQLYPEVVENGVLQRQKLGALAFKNPHIRKELEAIFHPLVHQQKLKFIKACRARRAPLAALDIPLLFETGSDDLCHKTLVVTAPPFIQKHRVLRRKGMTLEKMQGVLKAQLPDAVKRRRADYLINTGLDKGNTARQLRRVFTELHTRAISSR
jgi:dephospho-CoA kinase